MDLSSMSLAQLRELDEQVKAQMQKTEKRARDQAIEQIYSIANSVGLPLKSLLGSATGKKGPAPIKYRDPTNDKRAWSGRGRQPQWVKDWVEGGKSLDQLRA